MVPKLTNIINSDTQPILSQFNFVVIHNFVIIYHMPWDQGILTRTGLNISVDSVVNPMGQALFRLWDKRR